MTVVTTVDLPAHNAYIESSEDLVTVVGSEAAETLASMSTSSYYRFTKTTASGVGNGWAFRVGRGGSMLGFGLWTQPEGSTVTDVRFVMIARLPGGGGGDIPNDGNGSYGGGAYDSSYTNLPVYRWPMLMLRYSGASIDYNFSQINTNGAWAEYLCNVSLRHNLFGSDYVIAGLGTPDTGTKGLCPRVFIDSWYPWPVSPDVPIDLAYLAIRITYTTPTPETIVGQLDNTRVRPYIQRA